MKLVSCPRVKGKRKTLEKNEMIFCLHLGPQSNLSFEERGMGFLSPSSPFSVSFLWVPNEMLVGVLVPTLKNLYSRHLGSIEWWKFSACSLSSEGSTPYLATGKTQDSEELRSGWLQHWRNLYPQTPNQVYA